MKETISERLANGPMSPWTRDSCKVCRKTRVLDRTLGVCGWCVEEAEKEELELSGEPRLLPGLAKAMALADVPAYLLAMQVRLTPKRIEKYRTLAWAAGPDETRAMAKVLGVKAKELLTR